MVRAMSKYKQYFNAACDQRYKLSRYRRELSVVEELRAAEEKKSVELAQEALSNKKSNVKGFKAREEAKDELRVNIKRSGGGHDSAGTRKDVIPSSVWADVSRE